MHTPGGGGYGRPFTTTPTSGSCDEAPENEDDKSEGCSSNIGSGTATVGGRKTFVERGSVFAYRQAQESV